MESLKKELVELKEQFTTLSETVEKLKSDNKKMARQLKKVVKEQEPADKPKRANGFAKPLKMSPELCNFLGVSEDTEMARTEVTKAITEYVKKHNLQNPDNKRELILDDKLKSILKPDNDVTVTFFNLQRWVSPHYKKSVPESKKEPKTEPPPEPEPSTPKVVKRIKKKA
jgi:upstream activation factor subunit UAF30